MFGKNKENSDLEAFIIHDSKSGSYGVPQFAPNALSLIREYEAQWPNMVKNGSMFASHSEDYTIFKIGTYSYKTGKIETQDKESVIGFHEIRTSVLSRANQQRHQLGLAPELSQ